MKLTGFGIAAVAVATFTAWTAWAVASKPITLQLRLPRKSVEAPPRMTGPLTRGPLSLAVEDARHAEDPALVGAAMDGEAEVYRWRTSAPVAPAVEGFIKEILEGWSVPLAREAELGLRFQIVRYSVTEKSETFGSSYLGDVRLRTSFVDRSGRVLWTGESSGSSKRPGVDGRASMCNEALSLALRSALSAALAAVKPDAEAPREVPAPAEASPPAAAPKIAIDPDAMLADLTRLNAGGVDEDVLVGYVERRSLTRPLTVDDILRWKNSGIPDAAIKAATRP